MEQRNLLNIPETRLPDDPETEVAKSLGEGADARLVASRRPASSLAWAVLAEEALEDKDMVTAYAFARTGYHRGLDALRRAGWKGQGPVPWSHGPNRGFLRALAALGRAADGIGEADEAERVNAFLADCDPSAATQISRETGA